MTPPFDRYNQNPGAIPTRPWWSVIRVADEPVRTTFPPRYLLCCQRTDGVETGMNWWGQSGSQTVPKDVLEQMAQIDKDHPLPVPEPRCGQVWAFPDGPAGWGKGSDQLVTHVNHEPDPDWPRKGGVLVAGPLSPWAPPDWSPDE